MATKRFLLILLLTCMWSPSFLFIKLAIEEIPIYTVVTLRVGLAAILLGAVMLVKGLKFPKDLAFWVHSGVFAFLSSVLPFCMFCSAEQTIDSSLAALLNGTTPMFTALLAHLFVASDRLDAQKGTGIVVSSIGLLALFWPSLQGGVSASVIGMTAAMTGAFSYAVSHVYAKKYFSSHPPYVAPTAQLLLSTLFVLPFAVHVDQALWLPWPSLKALVGVGGLAFLGTFIAFILYYRILTVSGPTALSMTACFFPVGGMLLGALFLGEAITPWSLFSAAIILLGIACVNGLIQLPKLRKVALKTN